MKLSTAKNFKLYGDIYDEQIVLVEDYQGRGCRAQPTAAISCDSYRTVITVLAERLKVFPEEAIQISELLADLSNTCTDAWGRESIIIY